MNHIQTTPPITADLVAESERLSFLPTFFGPRLMLRGEVLVFGWLDRLSADYTGGLWNFYTLMNGGFYLAPSTSKRMRLAVEGNGFDGRMSADAAGVVATLFALDQLAGELPDSEARDNLIDHFHSLRDYAKKHAEAHLIFRAID